MQISSDTAARKLGVVAVILLCSLSAGGQRGQENQQAPAASSMKEAPAEQRTPGAQLPPAYTVDSPGAWEPLRMQQEESESGCRQGGNWEPGCYEKIVQAIPTVKGKAEYLARAIDTLQVQMNALQAQASGVGTYQITATRFGDGEVTFAQVFRVDTRTGYVCQVFGPSSRRGEEMGTSIPACSR